MKILKTKSPLVFAFLLCVSKIFAVNPIIQTNYTADPSPMVYNDRLYLYTSHDDDVTEDNFYTMRDYYCYSTTDLVNWTNHGIIDALGAFKWTNLRNGAWAAQCVERNGKFYLYVPVNGVGIGVLVSDSPTGPFTDPIGKALIGNHEPWKDIDPTVYIDTDGQAYMYWGNGGLWYVKLNEDMVSYSGSIGKINPTPTGFVEGPWFCKRNSLYYMAYAGMGSGNENLQYAISSSPTGPWTYKGVLMDQGNCFTIHPGICEFKGKDYLFYHNATLPGSNTFKRSVCVEEFTYKEDGSIPKVTMSSDGPAAVGNFNPYDTIEAETMHKATGVSTETCSEGGLNISLIQNNDNLMVKGVDFGTGANMFEARVAASSDGGKIEMYIDKIDGTLIGTCDVPSTGGWQTWQTVSCEIANATGIHDLHFKFTGGNSYLLNVNWWRFQDATNVKFNKLPVQRKSSKNFVNDDNIIRFNYNVPENFLRGNLKVTFSDLQGKVVFSRIASVNTQGMMPFTINKKQLRSGMYVVHVSAENKVLFSSSCMLY